MVPVASYLTEDVLPLSNHPGYIFVCRGLHVFADEGNLEQNPSHCEDEVSEQGSEEKGPWLSHADPLV